MSLRLLRIIAHYTLVTPVEAEGEFSYTIKNEGNADINIVLFPRFRSFYFQRLEVFDSNGRMLDLRKMTPAAEKISFVLCSASR